MTTQLDRTIKQEWLDLLRGDTIKQCLGGMINADGQCCAVGVLAKVLEKRGLVTIHADPDLSGFVPVSRKGADVLCGYTGTLPPTVAEQLGLWRDVNGNSTSVFSQIPRLNDGGATFNEIANWIEKKL